MPPVTAGASLDSPGKPKMKMDLAGFTVSAARKFGGHGQYAKVSIFDEAPGAEPDAM